MIYNYIMEISFLNLRAGDTGPFVAVTQQTRFRGTRRELAEQSAETEETSSTVDQLLSPSSNNSNDLMSSLTDPNLFTIISNNWNTATIDGSVDILDFFCSRICCGVLL